MKTDQRLLEEITDRLDRSNLTIRSDLNQFQDWYRKWRKNEFEQPATEGSTAEDSTSQGNETQSLPPVSSQVPDGQSAGAPDESLHDSNPAEAKDGADTESGQSDQDAPTVDNSGSQ